ncbi:MAG: hypothetical protein IPJ77_20795 [Planctomycetes bacterium]|nr:hypothetical protein [Planctomycetota bacterium]
MQKLRWFAATDGTSGLQWRDVRAVLKAMRGRLDLVFLREWGDRLGVRAELERALIEAGYEEPDAESRP